jgi:tRNA(Arg) A34 adenosine deaminase TadA
MLPLLQVAGQVADLSVDRYRKAFVGCILVRADGVIVKSRNSSTSPHCSEKTPSSHAEIRALRKAGQNATAYVSRLKRDGSYGLAKPCPRCMSALRSRGVEMVYWTVSNNEWEAQKP